MDGWPFGGSRGKGEIKRVKSLLKILFLHNYYFDAFRSATLQHRVSLIPTPYPLTKF